MLKYSQLHVIAGRELPGRPAASRAGLVVPAFASPGFGPLSRYAASVKGRERNWNHRRLHA
jgi:hypothetical protein